MDIVLVINSEGLVHPVEAEHLQHFLDNGWKKYEPTEKKKNVKMK